MSSSSSSSVALGKRKRAVTTSSSTTSAPPSSIQNNKKKQARPTVSATTRRPLAPQNPEPKDDHDDDDKEEDEQDDREALNQVFRRAFEKRFKAIEKDESVNGDVKDEEAEEEEDDGDWNGISEAEEEAEEEEEEGKGNHVEVVEYMTMAYTRDRADHAALKAFMTAKPPTSTTTTTNQQQTPKNSKPPTGTREEEDEEKTNQDDLKNDLALQRLLKESHLLDSTSLSSTSTQPTGKNRHKATDLRLVQLGSKTSLFTQKHMPKQHRQGIQKKKLDRESQRRREAKENGIVLERVKKEGGAGDKKRERGIGNPSVGRFSGGTLRLSKSDVEGITGPKSSSSARGRGGKGGGRGGRRGKR